MPKIPRKTLRCLPQFDQGLLYNFAPLTSIFGALAVLDPLVANDLVALGYDKKKNSLSGYKRMRLSR
jgi:hypothetical protein